MALLMAASYDLLIRGTGVIPSPYAYLEGTRMTQAAGLRGTFSRMQLSGFSHYQVVVNIIPEPATDSDLFWNQDFVLSTAGADNSEWCLWAIGDFVNAQVDYAIALKYTGSVAKLAVYEVTWGTPTPSFSGPIATGSTSITVGTIRRIAFEVDVDGANYPLKVHLDTGSGFPGTPEISTSSSNVRKPSARTTHYQFEIVAGDKEGDILVGYDNEIWNDDSGGSVSSKQDRTEICMGHQANASLISPSDWVAGDADNKKYWLTAGFNRNTGTPSDPSTGDDEIRGDTNDEDGFAIVNKHVDGDVHGIVTEGNARNDILFKLCTTEDTVGYGTAFEFSTITIRAYPLTPKGDAWTDTIFNTLQVQVKAFEDNVRLIDFGVCVVGSDLSRPAASADDLSDVASICPVAPPATRRIFITT